jgi:hypothetical protein
MPRKPSLSQAQKSYLARVNDLLKHNASFRTLFGILRDSGKNYVSQKSREESKVYDDKIITSLEEGFSAIDQIIANPRSFIKEEEEVVMAGLAKKITSASINHLASHSELVHSVDAKGNVTPERILTIETEEDLQIYENRFVMTLINKAMLFIEKRYQFIKDHGETRDSDVLLLHGNTNIDGADYECDTRVKISMPSKDNGRGEHNADLLKRLMVLRERAAFYMHCPFMQQMVGAKPVHNPIMMTNIIVKSPNYHKAYILWRFIDAYTKLGVSYNVKETDQTFDEPYFKQVYALILSSMLTLHSNMVKDKKLAPHRVKKKTITPRVLLSLEDETFLDSKFLYDQFPEKPIGGKSVTNGIVLPKSEAEVKAEKKRLADKAKRDAQKAKELIALAEAKKEKAAKLEADRLAKKERERKAAIARAEAKKAAEEKKAAIKKAREEAKAAAEAERRRLENEEEMLRKAREAVKEDALNDRKADEEAEKQAKEEATRKQEEEDSLLFEKTFGISAHPEKEKPVPKEKPVVIETPKEEPVKVVEVAPLPITPIKDEPLELMAPNEEKPVAQIEQIKPIIAKPAPKAKVVKKRKPKKKAITKTAKKEASKPILTAPIVPVEHVNTIEEGKPVESSKQAEEVKPVEKPVETKLVEAPKAIKKLAKRKKVVKKKVTKKPVNKAAPKKEEPKPVEKPVEVKPVKKPVETKPAPKKEEVKPSITKPVEIVKPLVAKSAQPITKEKKPKKKWVYVRHKTEKKIDTKVVLKKKGHKFVASLKSLDKEKKS